jgi:hypothetical protein
MIAPNGAFADEETLMTGSSVGEILILGDWDLSPVEVTDGQ